MVPATQRSRLSRPQYRIKVLPVILYAPFFTFPQTLKAKADRAADDRKVCQDLVLHDLPSSNPFRDLIVMSGNHPVLQHIIIANSALHLANATLQGSLRRTRPSRSLEIYNTALSAKHGALLYLSEALTHRHSMNSDVILASIMLFIMFELLDSGTNDWRFHIDGARQLMIYLQQNGRLEPSTLSSLRNCLVSNCVV